MGLGVAVAGALVAIASIVFRFTASPAGVVGDDGTGVRLGSGKMFDKVAGGYDLVNTVLTMRRDVHWRNMMIESLQLEPGCKVLDVGTGTAEVAIAVASHIRKNQGGKMGSSKVLGVDPSEGMITIGREKVIKAGFDPESVNLVIGDAEDLSWSVPGDTMFDGSTMAFVIRNVPNRAKAVAEIVSRLKPGSRLAVLELGFPTFPPARWFVRHGVPFIGWALSGGKLKKEYTYLNDSMRKFRLDDIADLMTEAGLQVVLSKRMNFGSVGLFVGQKGTEAELAQDAGADTAGVGEHGTDSAPDAAPAA